MTCPQPEDKGVYLLGPQNGVTFTNPLEFMDSWNLKPYTGTPVDFGKDTEWAFGTCSRDSFNFEKYVLKAPYKEVAYTNSLFRAQDMTKKSQLPAKRPMLIAWISIDSYSRRHFYRKMENTVNRLNQIKSEGTYEIFDFKVHNVAGSDTAENMSPVWGDGWIGVPKAKEFKHGKKLPNDRFGD